MDQSNAWLLQDPANVIAVHCKGGKGRTGMVVACLLLRQGIQCDPAVALDFFAAKRKDARAARTSSRRSARAAT